jgi:hypothetical protein
MKRIVLMVAACLPWGPLASPGGEPGKVPAKAIEAMGFLLGQWEAVDYWNGEKIGSGGDRRTWAPGKHCQVVEWWTTRRGVPIRATAVAGWDAQSNALVERWFATDGASLVNRWPPEQMKEDRWDGSFCFTPGDGAAQEGKCALKKAADGYEYDSQWTENGKPVSYKSVARRAKDGKAPDAKLTNIPAKAIQGMQFFTGGWVADGIEFNDKRDWVPGKHCLTVEWLGKLDGRTRFYGVFGWDARTNALVDHWFGDQGQYYWHSYPLEKMNEQVWQGECSLVRADGKAEAGKSQLRKTRTGYEWEYSEPGKPVEKVVMRRAGASYQPLQFFEAAIGCWKGQDNEKKTRGGEERSAWILDKNFMRTDGWEDSESYRGLYEFITGWDAKEKQVFSWAFGGYPTDFGIIRRAGQYDPAERAFNGRESFVRFAGEEESARVSIRYHEEDKIGFGFTERRAGDKPLPDRIATSTRGGFNPPKFDGRPGPGYERLKSIAWVVGDWKVRGTWADGKVHEGEERSEWAYNQNFIKGAGWWKDREGTRVDVYYVIGWDPKVKKVLLFIVDSRGYHGVRTIEYDEAAKTITAREEGVTATGDVLSYDQWQRPIDAKSFEWHATKVRTGNEDYPDLKIVFTRK